MIAAVVLAAGAARRFGAQKLVERVGGRAVVRWVAEAALASTADRVVVVLGREAGRVRAELADLPVVPVTNPDFGRGMSTSLHAGLRALPEDVAAAVVLLGDQPTVTAGVVDALVAAWRRTGASIVVPSYRGAPGNPVLFAASVFPELLAVQGDQGGRAVVAREPERVCRVPLDLPPPPDLDTLADRAAVEGALARGVHASPGEGETPDTARN